MTCVSSHRCLGSPVVRKKEFRLKRSISLEEINLSRQKQNYRFYLFDKSWYFPAKHVIYYFKIGVIYIFNCYASKLKVKKKHTLTFRYFLLNGGVPYGKSDYLPDWKPIKYKLSPFLNFYNIIIHMQNTMINPCLYYCISTLVNLSCYGLRVG